MYHPGPTDGSHSAYKRNIGMNRRPGRAASSCPIEKFGEFSDPYNFPPYDESLHNRSFTFAIKNRVPALLNGYFGLPH